jgi:hypothetical protein
VIDFGNVCNATGAGRPIDGDFVTAERAVLKGSFQGKGHNQLATTLSDLAKRPERASQPDTELFGEFAAGAGFRVFGSSSSRFGIDQLARSRLCQKGPAEWSGTAMMPASP